MSTTIEIRNTIINLAADRLLARGEDQDPLTAMAAAIEAGESVTDEEMEIILRLHQDGLWGVKTPEELEVFKKWCERAGEPFAPSENCRHFDGVPVYWGDPGDCVAVESARGAEFAIWTRPDKDRVQIGFRRESVARRFRACRPDYSLEETGNRHLCLVVLEGNLEEETVARVAAQVASAAEIPSKYCYYAWDWGRGGEGASHRHFTEEESGFFLTWTSEEEDGSGGWRSKVTSKEEVWPETRVRDWLAERAESLARLMAS